ncbi:MAG TPA: glycerophosphodiester phosphodiesterase [Geobacteraceae bacterium]|nr:glycerophosphodiester phosphodiesterase [Geobacteraceae bacterium]
MLDAVLTPLFSFRRLSRAAVCCSTMLFAGCGGNSASLLPTLNGSTPIVIAHRGASGYLPEETLEAYKKAIDLGADVLEFDLISTKDGVLIARHDPNLATSTDVASHPEFAARKKTTRVDGETQTGWFASDFTLAEIKTLGAVATDSERPQQYNGLYKIVTFQEIIDLVKAQRVATGRAIAIYPETKNPTYHRDLGLPLEDTFIDLINKAGLNSKTAPVYVQSFEPGSLKYMKSKGLNTRLIQLIDAADIDLKTGDLILSAPFDKPYDWAKAGDTRLFSDMVTPAGLAEIKTYADGIGPWKRYIITIKGGLGADGNLQDINGDGTINDADTNSQPPTALVVDAHKAGLLVHPYTFRNEQRRLANDYQGDPHNEYLAFYRLGVDGVFSDFADTAIAARSTYLKELGR